VQKTVQHFRAPNVRFLGEQDGPAERELKVELVQLFTRISDIRRAYLVRVTYGKSSSVWVALAVLSDSGESADLVRQIGEIFSNMFGEHENLDVIFLSPTEAVAIANCCKPFFDKG
jgi:SseB protein C-terminal domain